MHFSLATASNIFKSLFSTSNIFSPEYFEIMMLLQVRISEIQLGMPARLLALPALWENYVHPPLLPSKLRDLKIFCGDSHILPEFQLSYPCRVFLILYSHDRLFCFLALHFYLLDPFSQTYSKSSSSFL